MNIRTYVNTLRKMGVDKATPLASAVWLFDKGVTVQDAYKHLTRAI